MRGHATGGHGKGSGIRGNPNEIGGQGRYRNTSITVMFTAEERQAILDAVEGDGRSLSEIGRMLFLDWALGKVRKE